TGRQGLEIDPCAEKNHSSRTELSPFSDNCRPISKLSRSRVCNVVDWDLVRRMIEQVVNVGPQLEPRSFPAGKLELLEGTQSEDPFTRTFQRIEPRIPQSSVGRDLKALRVKPFCLLRQAGNPCIDLAAWDHVRPSRKLI